MLKDAHLLALGDLRLPTSHRALTRLNLVAARSQKGLCGPVSLVCGRGMKIRIPYSMFRSLRWARGLGKTTLSTAERVD